jgi:hypothetical protein
MDIPATEEQWMIEPGECLAQIAHILSCEEAKQLTDGVLDRREGRYGMVVAMNGGPRIVLCEISLESPVVCEAEREQGIRCSHCVEWHDIAAVIRTSYAD